MPLSFSKRQGKTSSSSVTLHDFFGERAEARNKTQITKRRASSKPHLKRPAISQEIIIIDSDSDDELKIAQVTEPKKRKFNKINEPNYTGTSTSALPAGDTSGVAKVRTEGTDTTVGQKRETKDAPSYYFGVPTLLLGSAEKDLFTQNIPHAFGAPNALLGTPLAETNFNPPSGSDVHAGSSSSVCDEILPIVRKQPSEVDIDLTLDDEWEMGDDETQYAREAAQEDSEMNDTSSTGKENSPGLCPYCEAKLDDLSVNVWSWVILCH